MTNLIPPESKKQLVRLYWIRLVSAWAILWSVALGVGVVLMYPTFLLITGTSAAYKSTVAGATERTEAYEEMVSELDKSSEEAQRIVRSAESKKLSGLLSDVWSVNGQGIDISGVQLNRDIKGVTPITLTGEAKNRQSLATFRDRIEALPYVEAVELPIGNLAQNQDIQFIVTVTINQAKL